MFQLNLKACYWGLLISVDFYFGQQVMIELINFRYKRWNELLNNWEAMLEEIKYEGIGLFNFYWKYVN